MVIDASHFNLSKSCKENLWNKAELVILKGHPHTTCKFGSNFLDWTCRHQTFKKITTMCSGLPNLNTNPQIKRESTLIQHPTTLLNTWKGIHKFHLGPTYLASLVLNSSCVMKNEIIMSNSENVNLPTCDKGYLHKILDVIYIYIYIIFAFAC